MKVYVAVYQEGKLMSGPQRGCFSYSLLAVARTKLEARKIALSAKGITKDGLVGLDGVRAEGKRRNIRQWRRARMRRIRIVRYSAALLLPGINPQDLLRYYAALMGVELPPAPRIGWILRRRRTGQYWDDQRRRWGERSRATPFEARKPEYIPAAWSRRCEWEQA